MPPLNPEQAHLWCTAQPEALLPGFGQTLDEQERDRASRFRFDRHREEYVFAHEVLRDVLSRYMQCDPAGIRFDRNRYGKPFLDSGNAADALQFNLSHSGGVVLIGVCRGRRIGVDVEEMRPMADLRAIAESSFAQGELNFVLDAHSAGRPDAFWRCWTRKEAFVKGIGKGLSIPLSSFDTLMAQSRSLVPEPQANAEVAWQVMNFELKSGYAAALAVECGFRSLIRLGWPDAAEEPLRYPPLSR